MATHKASPATKANMQATRLAACNTGNRDLTPGSLTIIYPSGGDYNIETTHNRHIREVCELMHAARVGAAFRAGQYAVANTTAAVRKLSTAAQAATAAMAGLAAVAPKAKPRRKVRK